MFSPLVRISKNKSYEVQAIRCEMQKKSKDNQQNDEINDGEIEDDNQNKNDEVFVAILGLRKKLFSWWTIYHMFVGMLKSTNPDKVELFGVLKNFNLSKICNEW